MAARGRLLISAVVLGLLLSALPSAVQAKEKTIVLLHIEGEHKPYRLERAIARIVKTSHKILPGSVYRDAAKRLRAEKLTPNNVKKVCAFLKCDGLLEGLVVADAGRYKFILRLHSGSTGVITKKIPMRLNAPRVPDTLVGPLQDRLLGAIDNLPSVGGGSRVARGDEGFSRDDRRRDRRETARERRDRERQEREDRARAKREDRERRAQEARDRREQDRREREDRARAERDRRDREERDRRDRDRGRDRGRDRDDRDRDRDVARDDRDRDRGDRDRDRDRDDRDRDRGDRDRDRDDRHAAADDAGDEGALDADDCDDRDRDDRDRDRGDRDRGDRDRRVAMRDDRDDDDPTASVESHGGASMSGPATPRTSPLVVYGGISVTGRKLVFRHTGDAADAPPGYKGAPVPGGYLTGALYPMAFGNKRGGLANLGIGFVADRVIRLQSAVSDGTGGTTSLATRESRYGIDVRYRHNFSDKPDAFAIEASVGYNKLSFVINKNSAPNGVVVDVPNVSYAYVDPGLTLHVPLIDRLSLGVAAKFMLVLDTGEIQTPDQYGAATVTGVDSDVGLEYRIGGHFLARAGGRLTYLGYAFKGTGVLSDRNTDGSADVGGASDRFLGGYATVGYDF